MNDTQQLSALEKKNNRKIEKKLAQKEIPVTVLPPDGDDSDVAIISESDSFMCHSGYGPAEMGDPTEEVRSNGVLKVDATIHYRFLV